MVINVEYNQLDPLLRASGYPNGDVNCETGYSPFPGNINQVTLFFILQHPPPTPPSHGTYLFLTSNSKLAPLVVIQQFGL